MKRPGFLRLVASGLLALLLVALAAQPASAHAVSTGNVVYSDELLCTLSSATVAYDHTEKVGTATARTEARIPDSYGCTTIDVFPPGHLAVRYDLWYLRSSDNTWQLCQSTDWTYNTTYTWVVTQSASYGPPQPCAPGQYQTLAISYVWDGSAWRGGGVWSGTHLMPV